MPLDVHIFASSGQESYMVRWPGWDRPREFTSLFAATKLLRCDLPAEGLWVVIHDDEGHANRIRLGFPHGLVVAASAACHP